MRQVQWERTNRQYLESVEAKWKKHDFIKDL